MAGKRRYVVDLAHRAGIPSAFAVTDSADRVSVRGVPGVSITTTAAKALRVYDALAQAEANADYATTPVVVCRRSHKPTIAILRADELFKLLAERD